MKWSWIVPAGNEISGVRSVHRAVSEADGNCSAAATIAGECTARQIAQSRDADPAWM
jgi:hypothetical protein